MTSLGIDIDPVLLGFLNDEPTLACDNADSEWCQKEEVQWRALIKCPGCKRGRTELWCDPCKSLVTVTEDGFECAQCSELVFPARRFVSMFLPLEGILLTRSQARAIAKRINQCLDATVKK